MTYQQKQITLQPKEGDISTSPLPFQEHCITALPFITVPDRRALMTIHLDRGPFIYMNWIADACKMMILC